MNKKDLLESVQDQILAETPKNQAKAINALEEDHIPRAALFLLETQNLFLGHLSIRSLIVLVRFFLNASLEVKNEDREKNSVILEDFKYIISLPLFEKVWEKIQYDKPVANLQFIPLKFLQQTLKNKLKSVTVPVSCDEMETIIMTGSRAETILSAGLAEEEDIATFKKEKAAMEKIIDQVGKTEWIIELMKVLPATIKWQVFFGKQMTNREVKKVFTVCTAQIMHVSDGKNDSMPLGLLFADFAEYWKDRKPHVDDQKEEKKIGDLLDIAEPFALFAKKMGPTDRLCEIFNFFNFVTYNNEQNSVIVHELPTSLIKTLFSEKKCLWMKEYLSDDQKIALKSRASVKVSDICSTINKGGGTVSSNIAQVVKGFGIKEKMELIASV